MGFLKSDFFGGDFALDYARNAMSIPRDPLSVTLPMSHVT